MTTLEIICSILGAIAVILSGVWFIVNKAMGIGQTKEKLKNIEDKTKHSNCKDNTESISTLKGNIGTMSKDMSYLRGILDAILKNKEPISLTQSPDTLTPLGEEIAAILGADEIIDRNWEKTLQYLETEIPNKNAYDIQQYCLLTATVELEKFCTNEDVSKVKSFAYLEGMPIAYYAPIFGLKIRDRYLKYKGINIEEVDRHNPNKKQ